MESVITRIANARREFMVSIDGSNPKTLSISEGFLSQYIFDIVKGMNDEDRKKFLKAIFDKNGKVKTKGMKIMGMKVISTPKQAIEVF